MCTKMSSSGEGSFTLRALMWFDFGVGKNVGFQLIWSVEFFVAAGVSLEGTLESFDWIMDKLVSFQLVAAIKSS